MDTHKEFLLNIPLQKIQTYQEAYVRGMLPLEPLRSKRFYPTSPASYSDQTNHTYKTPSHRRYLHPIHPNESFERFAVQTILIAS